MNFIKDTKALVEKTKGFWLCTYCEPTEGWPDKYTLIWRSQEYHGKIGMIAKTKKRPTDSQIEKALIHELTKRFESSLDCDAKKVARMFFSQPCLTEIDGCRKEIEQLITRNSDELAKQLEQICDTVEGNQLMQRVKDIAHAQEQITEIDKFINRNLKRENR